MNLGEWLSALGLGEYASAFAQSDVDIEVLGELSDEDLKDLGLSLGHRRKLQKALREQPPVELVLASPPKDRFEPSGLGEAERRQLTVMFADIVGSTELSQRFDPEDLQDITRAFQDAAKAAIEEYGGFIARYMGDGVLAYFGYPRAHEDDAERSVRSGLDLIEGVRGLTAPVVLSVRVGIATGPVVVGDVIGEGASQESAVVGETPNLAARLQSVGIPNRVVISEGTRRLLSEYILTSELGVRELAGFSEPVRVIQVNGVGNAFERDQGTSEREFTPLCGRQEELDLVLKRWAQSKDGSGQVVLLSGEPGLGKSRIVEALKERLSDELPNRVLYFCSPYHTGSALYPVIEQLERAVRIERRDTPEVRLLKLKTTIEALGIAQSTIVPYLASILSLPEDAAHPVRHLDAKEHRRRNLDAMIVLIEAMATKAPVLMVVEDLHWVDPTTLELLAELVERIRNTRVLALFTCRPEFEAPWGTSPNLTVLTLNNLTESECREILARRSTGKALPEELIQEILAKTDGVPLFVEELTEAVLESGALTETEAEYVLTEPMSSLGIPSSLKDLLFNRLDRLGEAKEIAQLASVLGRSFSRGLLEAISSKPDRQVEAALDQLLGSGLMYRRRTSGGERYEFKHALIRDAAYESLLKRSRERIHRQVAELIEVQFPELVSAQPELTAHHYTEAGCTEQALDYWMAAGLQALERWATGEAVGHLQMALKLLAQLPQTDDRDQKELEVQMALGPALQAYRGYAAPATDPIYERAIELGELLGDKRRACLALRGRQLFCLGAGELSKSRRYAERLRDLAKTQVEVGLRVGSCQAEGQVLFLEGRFDAAREVLEAGAELIRQYPQQVLDWPGGQPGGQCYSYAALAQWMLGFPDKAAVHVSDALEMSVSMESPLSLLQVHVFAAYAHLLRRDAAAARMSAEEGLGLALEYDHASFHHFAEALCGGAKIMLGRTEEGMSDLYRGIEGFRAVGSEVFVPSLHLLGAQAHLSSGEVERGVEHIEKARDIAVRTGQHAWDAEICRLEGELVGAGADHDLPQAEACFQQAIETARKQGAKSQELRAVLSLAGQWRRQGKPREAHELLAPVYGWFTEGFNTQDLQDAENLLGEGRVSIWVR